MHEPHETLWWERDGPVRTEEEDLLKRAETDPYRLNAFRLAELSVDASPREIRSRMDLVAMAAKARHPVPPGPCRVLALPETPALEDIQEAGRALQSPERRLVEELFWLWPAPGGPSRDDPALQALARGDRSQAVEIWERSPNLDGNRAVALHNRAVLHHLEALALEAAASSRALDPNEAKRRVECWLEAISCWTEAFDNDGVWQRLRGRVRELADARVTEATVRALREALPHALVAMTVRHALKAAEGNSFSEVERHLGLLVLWDTGSEAVREALKRASGPVRRRIETLCEEAKADTPRVPLQAEASIGRLLMQARPFLAVLDALLPSEQPIREGTHDDIVETALSCQIRFVEKSREAYTDDAHARLRTWQTSETVLKLAVGLEGTERMRRRLAENLEIIRQNIKAVEQTAKCWFCKDRGAADCCADEVPLHRVTERVPGIYSTTVRYERIRTPVPRCPACLAAHARIGRYRVVALIVGILVTTGCILIAVKAVKSESSAANETFLLVNAALGCLAPFIGHFVGHVFAWVPRWRRRRFPPIRQALKEGWSIGEEPSE